MPHLVSRNSHIGDILGVKICPKFVKILFDRAINRPEPPAN